MAASVRYQGVQKESAGYKLLAAMGWKEGEGLGASKQGIKEHIKVKKKFENWGVGAVEAAETARNWTTGMLEFHRVLSTLSEITSQHAGKRNDDDEDDDQDDPDLDSDASDHEEEKKQKEKSDKKSSKKRKASAKEEKKKSKSKKNKKSSKVDSDNDNSADNSEEDDDEPKRVKQATHLGRFKKRERAKTVKNYSSNDLAAILGGDPFASVAANVQATVNTNTSDDSDAESGSSSDEENEVPTMAGNNPTTSSEEQQPQLRSAFQTANTLNDEMKPAPVAEEDKDLWWSGYFTRAGRLGSLRRVETDKGKIKAHGFSEQDQTNLYNLAQDNATQGRIGLGRSSMPKKVAGARWQGTKQRLGSDDEEEEEMEEEEQFEREIEEAKAVVIILPGGKVQPSSVKPGEEQQKQKRQKSTTSGSGDGVELVQSIKWKKVVTTTLQGSKKQRMKLTKLQKAIMEQHSVGGHHKEVVLTKITAVVEKSSKFVLDDGVVKLK